MNFIDRLKRTLNHASRPPTADLGLPCYACGQAATGWAIQETSRGGTQVIEGFAACDVHQLAIVKEAQTKAG